MTNQWNNPGMPERFWQKVRKSEGCWLWAGAVGANGYGKFHFEGANQYAHRVSFLLEHGRHTAEGMHVDHLCEVKLCVNPEHLAEVTPKENMARRDAGHGPGIQPAIVPAERWQPPRARVSLEKPKSKAVTVKTERKVIFARATAAEIRQLDERAKVTLRNRTNYVQHRLAEVASERVAAPKHFPDVVEGSEAVALFLRLPDELKTWVVAAAANAGVSTSRYVRGVLFSS